MPLKHHFPFSLIGRYHPRPHTVWNFFAPTPKRTRWLRQVKVSAVPSSTRNANSLQQLSACCWHFGTLSWQLSGNEITQLGYFLPLSGTWSTILSHQWTRFSPVKWKNRWNIWPRQGALSLAVLGAWSTLALLRQEIWDSLTPFSWRWCWRKFSFILKVLAAWLVFLKTAPAAEEESWM